MESSRAASTGTPVQHSKAVSAVKTERILRSFIISPVHTIPYRLIKVNQTFLRERDAGSRNEYSQNIFIIKLENIQKERNIPGIFSKNPSEKPPKTMQIRTKLKKIA